MAVQRIYTLYFTLPKNDVLPVDRKITVEQAILMIQFQGYKIKSATE